LYDKCSAKPLGLALGAFVGICLVM
jgi:hypothetical protein